MRRTTSTEVDDEAGGGLLKSRTLAGAQTLVRGLDVMEAVASGVRGLNELSGALQLTRSTTHRLATTLVDHGYLTFSRRQGYALGAKLMELGFLAGRQLSVPQVARPHIEALAAGSGDTVHLGVLDGIRALYLDKIPGSRRVEISSRIGERQPLRSTGLGKALILGESEARWRELYEHESREGHRYSVDLNLWLRRMREYAAQDYAFDLEENEDRIRCVAAPIRDVRGAIVAAVSVSSAAQYMDEERMHHLVADVKETARAISEDLGWNPQTTKGGATPSPKTARKRA